jgi:hypothetical protein
MEITGGLGETWLTDQRGMLEEAKTGTWLNQLIHSISAIARTGKGGIGNVKLYIPEQTEILDTILRYA